MYDAYWEQPARNQRASYDVGVVVLTIYVAALAYGAVTPFILPFGLIYFSLMWVVWRYQALYVWEPAWETGGTVWPFFARRLVACLGIMVVFTVTMLIVKAAYVQAGIMLFSLGVFLIAFSRSLGRFDAAISDAPLWEIQAAPRIEPDAAFYTAAPLRSDAEAVWYPEWGKAWQFWLMPRYGL